MSDWKEMVGLIVKSVRPACSDDEYPEEGKIVLFTDGSELVLRWYMESLVEMGFTKAGPENQIKDDG